MLLLLFILSGQIYEHVVGHPVGGHRGCSGRERRPRVKQQQQQRRLLRREQPADRRLRKRKLRRSAILSGGRVWLHFHWRKCLR